MRRSIIVMALLALAGMIWVLQAQAPASKPADEQAIRQAAEAFSAAFNKGDLDGLLSHWTNDADYVDDDGKTHKGKAVIGALLAKSLAAHKGHTMTTKLNSLKLLRPDVAVEDGTVIMTAPDGDTESNRYTAVWVKSGDRWLMSSVRDLPAEDEATPAPKPADHLKELSWMVGDWAFEDKDKGVSVTVTCRWALNRNYLHQEFKVQRKEGEPVEVSQWIGWDAGDKQIRSWVFDSHGGHAVTAWHRDGNAWKSDSQGVLPDGRTGVATNVYRFGDDQTFTWQSVDRAIDGQPVPDAEIKFTRKGANP